MVEYTKPWLSVKRQIAKLENKGVDVGDYAAAARFLQSIGYYRISGYLYPYRQSTDIGDPGEGRRILDRYQTGTTLAQAQAIVDFDRELRMLVLDGIERIEVAIRMQIGYVLGRTSPFSYESPSCFVESFTSEQTSLSDSAPSKHVQWLMRVNNRKSNSDETFIEHFREKYNDQIPIWVLTEILEFGQLSLLYRGLQQKDAEEIAHQFGVPTKKLMSSWLASLNYVRNVAAHHARLFNRKLQYAPSRPKLEKISQLDHLRDDSSSKGRFGTYNALAVIAYLLQSLDQDVPWKAKIVALFKRFPEDSILTIGAMGVPDHWESLELWQTNIHMHQTRRL